MSLNAQKLLMRSLYVCLCGIVLFFIIGARPFLHKPCVNIYDWYGVLPQSVIHQFEEETHIRVHYDVFDNNEILEAKLLASNSGYDVVFPTVTPYAVRQMSMQIYQKLDKSLLPNLRELPEVLKKHMQEVDPNLDFILPYYWGTTGIAYDADKLERILHGPPPLSNALLFDPTLVRQIAPFGISLLQEPVDVIPQVLHYLGLDRDSRSFEDLYKVAQHMESICPYIRRFSSSRFITDLVLGDVCVAQAWSGEALKAIKDAKKVGKNIRYFLPQEGAEIWIDAVAIPIGAPNTKNAHAFINFLLRPDISAKITNYSKMATMVTAAKKYIAPEILNNPLIFPPQHVQEHLFMQKPCYSKNADAYERVRARVWAHLKKGLPIGLEYFQSLVFKQKTHETLHTEEKHAE